MKKRTRAGKYIDPTTDYGFKRIFGKDANSELLLSLLNGLFQGEKVIEGIEYVGQNEQMGNTRETGMVIFDLICTTDRGDKILIEVQRSRHATLKERMLYYGCRIVADQAPDGGREDWGYRISGVYVIVLMDGFSMPGGSNGNVLHSVRLCDTQTKEVFYENFGFIYVELENFEKTEREVEVSNNLDKWLYVLKNMSKMEAIPKYLRKTIFEKVFDIAEYSNLNKEEREMYDASLNSKWDEISIRNTAIEEGVLIGMEKERARHEREKISTAMYLKKMGLSVEDISRAVGLGMEDIERL